MNSNKQTADGEASHKRYGRPRTFDDVDVFVATARAVRAHGYARLTIDAVAKELGCSGPALMGRFGSKSGLLRSYLEWANAASVGRFRNAREAHASPLDALYARFRIPTDERQDEMSDPARYINFLLFHVAAWGDADLRDLERARREMLEAEIAALLADAQKVGELVDCDVKRLATVMLSALTGVALQWASDQACAIGDRQAEVMDELLKPYRAG
jgi:AcrR family transcriptional regulator